MAREITAAATVARAPADVFAFLADLHNHWLLEDRFVELGGVDADGRGGRVRVVGPLGLSREARTEVLAAQAPEDTSPGTLHGRAFVGRATVGRVRWDISRNGAGTVVRLSAVVERASALDRLALAAGGAWWLRRTFAGALRQLDDALA